MPYTARDVAHAVRMSLKAFYPDAHPDALRLINEAHQSIVRECGLYPQTTVDVPLVAGAGEYVISPDVFRITSADMMDGPTSATHLYETSVSELDQTSPTWRAQGASRPSRYYEDGGNLGFYPAPNLGTSLGGYPIVRLKALLRSSLATIDAPLPDQIPSIQAWEWQVCFLWALRNEDKQVQKYASLARAALEDLKRFTQTKLARGKIRVVPTYPIPRTL